MQVEPRREGIHRAAGPVALGQRAVRIGGEGEHGSRAHRPGRVRDRGGSVVGVPHVDDVRDAVSEPQQVPGQEPDGGPVPGKPGLRRGAGGVDRQPQHDVAVVVGFHEGGPVAQQVLSGQGQRHDPRDAGVAGQRGAQVP